MIDIKKMTDDVIDLAMENMYSEIEEWLEEDGWRGHEINLSPKPELYEKLTEYFTKVMLDLIMSGKLKTQLTYAGDEPKMEVCDIVSKDLK